MLALQNTHSAPTQTQREVFARNEARWPTQGDLPAGALVEVSGPHARQAVAALLARYPNSPIAWVELNLQPVPYTLQGSGLNFLKTLFIDGRKDASWAASAMVSSGEFPFVVYGTTLTTDRELRRLLKQARITQTTCILVSSRPSSSTLFQLQLRTDEQGLSVWRRRK